MRIVVALIVMGRGWRRGLRGVRWRGRRWRMVAVTVLVRVGAAPAAAIPLTPVALLLLRNERWGKVDVFARAVRAAAGARASAARAPAAAGVTVIVAHSLTNRIGGGDLVNFGAHRITPSAGRRSGGRAPLAAVPRTVFRAHKLALRLVRDLRHVRARRVAAIARGALATLAILPCAAEAGGAPVFAHPFSFFNIENSSPQAPKREP